MIRALQEEDIDGLISRMSSREIDAVVRFGIAPKAALQRALGPYSFVGTVDAQPVCAFGLLFPIRLGAFPEMWLLTTVDLRAHRIEFLREARVWVRAVRAEFGPIEAFCQVPAQRLLRWLGFAPIHSANGLTRMRI